MNFIEWVSHHPSAQKDQGQDDDAKDQLRAAIVATVWFLPVHAVDSEVRVDVLSGSGRVGYLGFARSRNINNYAGTYRVI